MKGVRAARGLLWAAGTLPKRTQPFAEFVRKAKGKEYQAMHPAKLTFQALRIHLNKEFEQLQEGIQASLKTLKTGGKLGIITWKHSACFIASFIASSFAMPGVHRLTRIPVGWAHDPCRRVCAGGEGVPHAGGVPRGVSADGVVRQDAG